MKQSNNKIAFGLCLSDLDRSSNFRFNCMGSMKESFCMFRTGIIECDSGNFYADKSFQNYAETCNKLSIPWVGYIYLYLHTDDEENKIVLPDSNVWDIFKEISLSLPFVVLIVDFELPNFDIDRLNKMVQQIKSDISDKIDKPFTVCVGFAGFNRELATCSEFRYPLYMETLGSLIDNSIDVPNNTILCWYMATGNESDRPPSYFYLAENNEDRINIVQKSGYLDTVIALGELADAVYNYEGAK